MLAMSTAKEVGARRDLSCFGSVSRLRFGESGESAMWNLLRGDWYLLDDSENLIATQSRRQ
jgi:hypothetical protein